MTEKLSFEKLKFNTNKQIKKESKGKQEIRSMFEDVKPQYKHTKKKERKEKENSK